MRGTNRVFGIFVNQLSPGLRVDTTALREGLAACGDRSAATFEMEGTQLGSAMYANVMLQMRERGVSTIFCLCHAFDWAQLGAAATSNGYFPEWLVGTYQINDWNYFVRAYGPAPEQRAQAMGLTFLPHQAELRDEPAFWAEVEMDPSAAQSARTGFDVALLNIFYRSLLLVASGVQMAGPHLTPATFESGLHRTVFPNPDHPIKAGNVGFDDGDHSMTNDVAEYWWSNVDRGPMSEDVGAICYVDEADRRVLGRFPSGDEPFFKGPCFDGA